MLGQPHVEVESEESDEPICVVCTCCGRTFETQDKVGSMPMCQECMYDEYGL